MEQVTMQIRPFEGADEDEEEIVSLWRDCGLLRSWNDPRKDIARKRRVQPELFLVGRIDGRLVGSVMAGYDGHRGWVNYLAVAPEWRRAGLGAQLMAAAEAGLAALGCPKVNLQVRGDNPEATAFYSSLGYLVDDVLSMGKRLEHDT
jgi:ribosomal protein S18 acetylase RimI-like enzyme